MAHWLSMRYRVSWWHANRWISTAHALEHLPLLAGSWGRGELGMEQVIELARFATPETEGELVEWARQASRTAIHRRAELETRRSLEEERDVERSRRVNWWYHDGGRRFALGADLPAADGAVVARALDRLAGEIPVMPGEEDDICVETRRADALVSLASARIATDADPDRATVIVHASLEALAGGGDRGTAAIPTAAVGTARVGTGGAEIEGGPVIHPETARRLACDARIQTVVENLAGEVIGLGRMSREPSAWMMRQLQHRDHGCVFPWCGSRRFLHAHHILWWERGGRTDLDNLALVCSFHHKLVHEHGWRIERGEDGTLRWFRPDGTLHHSGPGPPPVGGDADGAAGTEQPDRGPVLTLGEFRPLVGGAEGSFRPTVPQARSPDTS
jgi:hypothetical protein